MCRQTHYRILGRVDDVINVSGHRIGTAEVEDAINQSLEKAKSAGITGNAITPFLLEKVSEASGNLTLQANIDLILNNVKTAGEVAIQMAG